MDLKTIRANLPVLGNTKIHFYKDSCTFWEFIDEKELSRLNRISHLGPASIAFSGANHTRLEYTLLQCAIIELVSKIHKDSSSIALSNGVNLNGFSSKSSSGEDVLKTWALLGAYGHTNWTYGPERVLLQLCLENHQVYRWMLRRIRNKGLKKWCQDVIENYDDSLFHYVIAIKRIYLENPYDRNKTKLVNYLRNLLLPVEHLFPKDLTARYKLYRLRELFNRIRMVSIVSIDSYYSHYPFRLQLPSALTDISTFSLSTWFDPSLENELENLVGWLADELYFSKKATPIQRAYEIEKKEKLKNRILKHGTNKTEELSQIKHMLHDGLGKPEEGSLNHLIRLTFENETANNLFGHSNKYELQNNVEKVVQSSDKIYASIELNNFKNNLNLDLHYSREADLSAIGNALINLKSWVIRNEKKKILEIDRLFERFKNIDQKKVQEIKKQELEKLIQSQSHLFEQLFYSVIRVLIPENWNISIRDYIPKSTSDSPIFLKFKLDDDLVFDDLNPILSNYIDDNPYSLDEDRIHELKALKRLVRYSRSQITIACTEKFLLTNNHGKYKDDWDGVLLQLDDKYLKLTVIEAKNIKGSQAQRENAALKQLEETKEILSSNFQIKYERKKIKDLGARLIVKLTE